MVSLGLFFIPWELWTFSEEVENDLDWDDEGDMGEEEGEGELI